MIRVAADTNICISALLFGGLSGQFWTSALLQGFRLVTSRALLDELDNKLQNRFHNQAEDAAVIQASSRVNANLIAPAVRNEAIAEDLDDNRVAGVPR